MMRLKDKLKTILYRTLRHISRADVAVNSYGACNKCKKYRRNWQDSVFKDNSVLGYDEMLGEWVVFKDYNLGAKIQVMNEYITNVTNLNTQIWEAVKHLCPRCVSKYVLNYKELENESR